LGAFGLYFKNSLRSQSQPGFSGNWDEASQLEYANTLLSKGLSQQAAYAYESYIDKCRANKKDLAGACYKLGNIYMDLQEYEPALRSFYKSEILRPNAEYKARMNERVVEALENLGLNQQAQYELESRTAVSPSQKKDEVIVAKIGPRQITQKEVDAAVAKLPQWMQQEAKTEEGKTKFIRDYVARQMLYEKAQKLGLDKTAKLKEALADIKKEIVLGELIKLEVNQNVKTTPEDLKFYYQANKDNYNVPAKIKISYVVLNEGDKKEDVSAFLQNGRGRRIEEWIEETAVDIPTLGPAKEAIAGLFKEGKGKAFGPVTIEGKQYLLMVDDTQALRELSFEEVKDQVQNDYLVKKQQEIVSTLIRRTLEQKEVEIFAQPKKEDVKEK
jgi:tetratricopeptide (TPR) repeat protein